MADIDWTSERKLCLRLGAVTIDGPALAETGTLGPETVTRSLVDVMDRKWWFRGGGIYTIRDERGEVLYLGFTNAPLGSRLRLATMRRPKATWAQCDYAAWTVSLRRGTEDDLQVLRSTLKPALMRGAGGPVRVPTVASELEAEASRLESTGDVAAAAAVRRVAARYTR